MVCQLAVLGLEPGPAAGGSASGSSAAIGSSGSTPDEPAQADRPADR